MYSAVPPVSSGVVFSRPNQCKHLHSCAPGSSPPPAPRLPPAQTRSALRGPRWTSPGRSEQKQGLIQGHPLLSASLAGQTPQSGSHILVSTCKNKYITEKDTFSEFRMQKPMFSHSVFFPSIMDGNDVGPWLGS